MQFLGGIEPVALHERDPLIALLDNEPDELTLVAQLSGRFTPPTLKATSGERVTPGGTSVLPIGSGVCLSPVKPEVSSESMRSDAVWNRSPEKAASLSAANVTVAKTPAAAAKGADFVVTMVAGRRYLPHHE